MKNYSFAIFFVLLGGGLGATLRYIICETSSNKFSVLNFPVGILISNLLGCFLIGFLSYCLLETKASSYMKLFLLTGFLGGLTTFSSYAFDSFRLLYQGKEGLFFLNVFLNNFFGILLAFVGYIFAKFLFFKGG